MAPVLSSATAGSMVTRCLLRIVRCCCCRETKGLLQLNLLQDALGDGGSLMASFCVPTGVLVFLPNILVLDGWTPSISQ